jgi:hypothetical protein
MAEYITSGQQNVLLNQPAVFDASIPCRNGFVFHEDGSGIFTLCGKTSNCFARYQITFNGKPDYDTRTILKQNGFRWAPSLGVWQRYNTGNGERALGRVAEKLGWKKDGE